MHVIARMNTGGTSRYINELVRNIPNSVVVCGNVQGDEIEDKCVETLPLIRLPRLGRKISLINDFKSWIELKKIVEDFKPDILHTHTFKAGLIGRLVSGNHKHVHTFHGHLFDDPGISSSQKIIITIVEKFLAKRSHLLISVGKNVGYEIMKKNIGINNKWISIPPGVATLQKYAKSVARKELGIPTNDLLIGWMGRVTSVKSPRILIDVAHLLPKLKFVLAGGGDLFNDIKHVAPKNVLMLGWTEASLFWSAVDCVISTSSNEGIPIALIEAQLAGLPVVATNVGSVSEVVIDGQTGLLTRVDSKEIASKLDSLVKNSVSLNQMGALAIEHAKLNFSISALIESHLNCYKQLLSIN